MRRSSSGPKTGGGTTFGETTGTVDASKFIILSSSAPTSYGFTTRNDNLRVAGLSSGGFLPPGFRKKKNTLKFNSWYIYISSRIGKEGEEIIFTRDFIHESTSFEFSNELTTRSFIRKFLAHRDRLSPLCLRFDPLGCYFNNLT